MIFKWTLCGDGEGFSDIINDNIFGRFVAKKEGIISIEIKDKDTVFILTDE